MNQVRLDPGAPLVVMGVGLLSLIGAFMVLLNSRRGRGFLAWLESNVRDSARTRAGLFTLVHSTVTFGAAFGSWWLYYGLRSACNYFDGGVGIGIPSNDMGLGTLVVGIPFFLVSSWIACFSLGRRVFGFSIWLSLALFGVGGVLGGMLGFGSLGQIYHNDAIKPLFRGICEFCWGLPTPLAIRTCRGLLEYSFYFLWTAVLVLPVSWMGIVLGRRITRLRTRGVRMIGLVIFLSLLQVGEYCRAYPVSEVDPEAPVHQIFLTLESATLLQWTHGCNYSELTRFSGEMAVGAKEQDIPERRGVMHFYRPTDERALFAFGLLWPSALQALEGTYCPLACLLSGGSEAYFDNAVDAYAKGQKLSAYEKFGYALHLATQDMYSPAHVFDDAHYVDAPTTYEIWVQANYDLLRNAAGRWGDSVDEFSGMTAGEILRRCAAETYRAVRVAGDIHSDTTAPASGELAEMFSPQHFQKVEYMYETDPFSDPAGPPAIISERWHIPDVGDCRGDTGAVGDPVYLDSWWVADNFDEESGKYFYFEAPAAAYPKTYGGIAVPGNQGSEIGPTSKSLAELWAIGFSAGPDEVLGARLLARAQEASAGFMKRFAEEVDDDEPAVGLMDSTGKFLAEDDVLGESRVYVSATDTGTVTASGIYRMILTKDGTPSFSRTVTFDGLPSGSPGSHVSGTTFYDLACGTYTVHVNDGLGNFTARDFTAAPLDLKRIEVGSSAVEGRVYPITIEFGKDVRNVSVFRPDGLVTFQNSKGEAVPVSPGPAKVFTGRIDLTRVCLDGQKLCMTVSGTADGCTEAAPVAVGVPGGVTMPTQSDVADLTQPQSTPVSSQPDCSLEENRTELVFDAPVINVSVVPKVISLGNATLCVYNASQADLDTNSAARMDTEWAACLVYRVVGGEIADGTQVSSSIQITWKNPCDTMDTTGCVGPDAKKDQNKEAKSANLAISFVTADSLSKPDTVVQWFDFEEFIGVKAPSWTRYDYGNLSGVPAGSPEMMGGIARERTVSATVYLTDPGIVTAKVEGVGGVHVVAGMKPGSDSKTWRLDFSADCNSHGSGALLLQANSGCATEYYKIKYNAGALPCVYLNPVELDKKKMVAIITGKAYKTGSNLKIIRPNGQADIITVFPTTPPPGDQCTGDFTYTYHVMGWGNHRLYGVNDKGDQCTGDQIFNADPTFMEDGRSWPAETPPSVVNVYLSPATSPGIADSGVLSPGFTEDALVTARVIDANGTEVRRLRDEEKQYLGEFLEWDGRDAEGILVSDGTYRLLVEGRGLASGASVGYMGAFVVDNTNPRAEFNRIDGMPVVGQSLQVYGRTRDDNFKEAEVRAITSTGATIFLEDLEEPVVRGPVGVLPNDLPAGPVLLVLTVRDLAGNETRTFFRFNIREPESLVNLRITVDDITGQVVSGQGQFVPDNPDIYIDDQATMPEGITLLPEGGWHFARAPDPVFTGRESHTSGAGAGHRVHYFIHADEPLLTDNVNNDLIIQYVYFNSSVQQIMLQFYTGNGDGEHRAYWGLNKIQTTGVAGTASLKDMGDLPPAGKWVRLRIPAKDVGVEGVEVKGIAFHVYGADAGARAYWDKTTTSGSNQDFLASSLVVEPNLIDDYSEYFIRFTLNREAFVTVDVVDSANQHVKRVAEGTFPGGIQQIAHWDGTNELGDYVVNGIYNYQFSSPGNRMDCDRLSPVFVNGYDPLPKSEEFPPVDTALAASDGNTWEIEVINPADPRVVRRDSEGILRSAFGKNSLNNPISPFEPVDLTLDPNGNVYVLDRASARLIKLSAEGTYLGETSAGLPTPENMIIDEGRGDAGHFFILDQSGAVLQYNVARGLLLQTNIVADIVLPTEETLVRGKVPIIGTATARNFWKYTLSLSRSIDGEPMWDIATSTSERVLTPPDLLPPGTVTLHGNLGTLDVGRDEYAYVDGAGFAGLNGVYTIKLRLDTLDERIAVDRTTIIVGRLVSQTFGGKVPSEDGRFIFKVTEGSIDRSFRIIAAVEAADLGRNLALYPFDGIAISNVYEMRPPCLKFSHPATLTIAYDPSSLDMNQDGYPDLRPEQLAIYSWDSSANSWIKLPGQSNGAGNSISAEVDGIQCGEALYAIFADVESPLAPVLLAPATPTVLPRIEATVLAQPGEHVVLYARHESTTYYIVAGEADTDPIGRALVEGVPLDLGASQLKAVAVDDSGNRSVDSNVVDVFRDVPPVAPTSVTFKDVEFTEDAPECCVDTGARLGIELVAEGDPEIVETAVAVVRSTSRHPEGIEIPAVETAADSGVFRGVVTLGDHTNVADQILAAGQDGESVRAEGLGAPEIFDAIGVDDQTPPPAPRISSSTHPSLVQATFEDGRFGYVSPAVRTVSVYLDSSTAATGEYSAKVVNNVQGGAFAVNLVDRSYNLADYPLLSFDYLIPPPAEGQDEIKLTLWVVTADNTWYGYAFTDKRWFKVNDFARVYFEVVGTIPDVVADGEWHHVEVQLSDKIGPRAVRRVFLGNYVAVDFMVVQQGGDNDLGAHYYLDNILVTKAGSTNLVPEFSWVEPYDHSGIAGYSVSLDGDAGTVASETPNEFTTSVNFTSEDIQAIGASDVYLHVRPVDGAGNVGFTNHYRIRVDALGPIADNPSPAPGSVAAPGVVSLRLTDPGGSGIDLEGVRLTINDAPFTPEDGGFEFDSNTGVLVFKSGRTNATVPAINNGDPVTVRLEAAPDKAGNPLQASLEWTFTASFETFARGQAILLTISGGRQPAWSPNAASIVYAKELGEEGSKLFTISPEDLQEKQGTVQQITQDPAGVIVNDSHPSWSPTAALVAFVREIDGQSDIYLVDVSTGVTTQLTDTPENESHPTWSPDGKKVIYVLNDNLWSAAVNPVGAPALLRDDTQQLIREPFWMYGSRLYYRDALYVDNIRYYDPGTGQTGTLTTQDKETQPAISAPGQQIVFVSRREKSGSQLWVMGPEGNQPVKLLDNPGGFSDSEPAFAPNGSAVAFESSRSGSPNIWLLLTLKLSPLLVEPPAFSPGNADGVMDESTATFEVTAEALATVKIRRPRNGTTETLVQDKFVTPASPETVTWYGLMNGKAVPDDTYTFDVTVASPFGGDPLTQSGSVRLDNRPPTTSLPAAGTFIKQGATFPVTIYDYDPYGAAGAGVKELRIREGANPFVTREFTRNWQGFYPHPAAAQVDLASLGVGAGEEGSHSIQVRSFDGVGNGETVKATTVIVDAHPPRIEVVPDGPVHETGGIRYARSSVKYRVQSFDDAGIEGANSGIAGMHINGASRGNPATMQFTQEGPRTLAIAAWDAVLHTSNLNYAVTVDDSPPVTAASTFPTAVSNGADLFVSLGASPELKVKAQDTASGVARVESRTYLDGLRVDGQVGSVFLVSEGDEVVRPLDRTGRWRVEFRATDHAGNVEAVKWFEVIVTERPLPGVTLVLIGPEHTDVNNRTYLAGEGAPEVTTVRLDVTNSAVTELRYRLDGGELVAMPRPAEPSPFRAEFTVSDGLHSVEFYGVRGSTEEVHGMAALHGDAGAPGLDSYFLAGAVLDKEGTKYLRSGAATAQVSFSDPPLSDQAAPGSGVAVMRRSFNGGAFASTKGEIAFTGMGSGPLSLVVEAEDEVGNVGAITRNMVIDDVAPGTDAIFNAKKYTRVTDGKLFVTYTANNPGNPVSIDLLATDNVGGIGVKRVLAKLDGRGEADDLVCSDPPVNPENVPVPTGGNHTVRFRAEDDLGNLEALKIVSFHFDRTAPTTAVVGAHPSYTTPAGQLYVGNAGGDRGAVTLTADDGAGSGLKTTYLKSGGVFVPYQEGAFVYLASEGAHIVTAYSVDRLDIQEPETDFTVLADFTPPALSVAPEADAATHTAGGVTYVAPGTRVVARADDPALAGGAAGSGTGEVGVRIDAGATQTKAESSIIAVLPSSEGVHTAVASGRDRVNNTAANLSAQFTVDATVPVTTLTPLGAYIDTGVVRYADAETALRLTAIDELADGSPGSGVREIAYRIEDEAGGVVREETVAASTVDVSQLPLGIHTITWRATDNVGNEETAHALRLTIVPAGEVPTVMLVVTGPEANVADLKYLRAQEASGASTLALRVVEGAATTHIRYTLDGVTETVPAPEVALGSLLSGPHTLSFRGVTIVGADEAEELATTAQIVGDKAAPEIAAVTQDTKTPAGVWKDGALYFKPTADLSVAASDPDEGGSPGSGVKSLTARLDSGSWFGVSQPLKISQEGAHALDVKASDRVDLAASRSFALRVDGKAPVSSVYPSGALTTNTKGTFASGNLSYAILAEDLPAGLGVGVESVLVRVDGSPETPFDPAVPIKFTTPGQHTIQHRAVDRLGSTEALKTFSVYVDAEPPTNIVLTVLGPSVVDGAGRRYGAIGTAYGATATDAGVGLSHLEIRRDDGVFSLFSVPVGFSSEGGHVLGVKAFDLVGNASSVAEFDIVTDATPPVTIIGVASGPSRQEVGILRIAPQTTLKLTAADPIVTAELPGSGVREIRYRIGVETEVVYETPFTVASTDGVYYVSFYGRDMVLNKETAQGISVLVDATAPATPEVSFDATTGNVVLTWTQNVEGDFAGYRVYRVVDGDPATRTLLSGSSLLMDTTLTDAEASGLVFDALTYEVVAVDVVDNASAPGTVVVTPADLAPRIDVFVDGVVLETGSFFSGASVSLTVRIRGAVDPQGELKRNGAVVANFTGEDYSVALADEGFYEVRVTALDRNGAEITDLRAFTIDRTPPVISVTGNEVPLADGTFTRGPLLLAFMAEDLNPDVVTATLNGSPVVSGITISLSGPYSLVVQAVDKAGNTAARTVGFVLDSEPPAMPTGLVGQMLSGTSALLSWEKNVESDLAGYRVLRDGEIITPVLVPQPPEGPVEYTDLTVPLGTATATYEVIAVDLAGNESPPASVSITFDITPPVTALLVGTPRFGAEPATNEEPTEPYAGQQPMFIAPATPLVLSAEDDITGVAGTSYRVGSEGEFLSYTTELSGGIASANDSFFILEFTSSDSAGNVEMVKTATLYVDTVAPTASIAVPGGVGCLELHQDVVGTADDVSLSAYRLEYAPKGTGAYVPIAPESEFHQSVVDGLLGVWDTTGLADGEYDLRLTVEDGVGNISSAAVTVSKGVKDTPGPVPLPSYVRELGGKGRKPGQMRLPVGVAVGADSRLYVADTQNHRIEVFNGPVLESTFGRHGQGEGKFNQPEGSAMAVGFGDRLYVADRQNNRVQVFDANGGFLFSWGHSGTGEGEFMHPSEVTVDDKGKVYVSDTHNHRVQVFDADGGFLLAFGRSGTGDGEFNQPAGIEVDCDGSVYVVDRLNDRIQVFDSQGGFLRMMVARRVALKHPTDVILSPDETHLYVSDTGHHEVVVLRKNGEVLGRFGGFGAGEGKFHEPRGLAWDVANGLLYVADTHNNRVQVFGLGAVTPSIAAMRPGSLVLPESAIGSIPAPAAPAAGAGVSLGELYVAPNPVDPRNGEVLQITGSVSGPAMVAVSILDKHGRPIRQFPVIQSAGGSFSVEWDGLTSGGTHAHPGEYSAVAVATNGASSATRSAPVLVRNKGGHLPGSSRKGVGP